MKSIVSAREIKSIQKSVSRAMGTRNVFANLDDVNAMENALKSVVSTLDKEADPDCFPPNLVRNRLEMFQDEFENGMEWIKMHRGYHIYKDYLADYYQVC